MQLVFRVRRRRGECGKRYEGGGKSPQGRPKGELAPKRVSAKGSPLSPQGRPKGELAPKRVSAEGIPVSSNVHLQVSRSERSRVGESLAAMTISSNVSSISRVDTAFTSGVTEILIIE